MKLCRSRFWRSPSFNVLYPKISTYFYGIYIYIYIYMIFEIESNILCFYKKEIRWKRNYIWKKIANELYLIMCDLLILIVIIIISTTYRIADSFWTISVEIIIIFYHAIWNNIRVFSWSADQQTIRFKCYWNYLRSSRLSCVFIADH